MKLKKLAQVLLVSGCILALGACSTTKHGVNGSDATGGANGPEASGAGQGNGYGDQGGASSEQLLAKRTYYFDYDKSEVRDEDKAAIYANADYLVAHPAMKATLLEGHTDPRGSREYNVALGERRANAVFEVLKSRGVGSNQVRVVSYGSEKPAAQGRTEQDFQLDRRAVLVIAQN